MEVCSVSFRMQVWCVIPHMQVSCLHYQEDLIISVPRGQSGACLDSRHQGWPAASSECHPTRASDRLNLFSGNPIKRFQSSNPDQICEFKSWLMASYSSRHIYQMIPCPSFYHYSDGICFWVVIFHSVSRPSHCPLYPSIYPVFLSFTLCISVPDSGCDWFPFFFRWL